MRLLCTVILLIAGCAPRAEWTLEQVPPALESRGVWLDKAEIVEGPDALAARLDRLRDAGFNTIYIAMQVRGCVTYPGSRILPQWDGLKDQRSDLIAWLVDQIHRRGMKAEAWTEFGFYAYHTPDAGKDPSRGAVLDAHPELVAVDGNGNTFLHNPQWGDFYSLCPSNPRSQAVLRDLYAEMLERFAFDGLNLDRIRYPSGDYCYCPYCREQFHKDTGLVLEKFADGSPGQTAFIRWRKENLVRFVGELSSELRRRFPGRRITSAVVPPDMIDEKGQDWPAWVERGYLDAAMPMLYAKDIRGSVQLIRERVGPRANIFYGLDAGQGMAVLGPQIDDLRAAGARGITIWYSKTVDPLLPELKAKFQPPAVSPLYP